MCTYTYVFVCVCVAALPLSCISQDLRALLQHSASLVAARELFSCDMQILSCDMWDLAPWPGIKPRTLQGGQRVYPLDHRGSPSTNLFCTLYLSCVFFCSVTFFQGLTRRLSNKESTCKAGASGDEGLITESGKIPWKGGWQPTPVFLPGKFQR